MNGAGHSVGMNRLALVFFVVVGSGCFVPIDITVSDGSVVVPDASTSHDAGIDGGADSGWTEVPCVPPATIDITPGTAVVVPGCSTATVTVYGPDGGIVVPPGETFTPSQPGVYVLETQLDGGQVQQTFVHVDGPLAGGFTRTYLDRVDRGQLFVTGHERLLMVNQTSMTIYEPDGGFYGYLDNASQNPSGWVTGVGVSGNSLWVINDGGLEHFTETEIALQMDGVNTHPIVADLTDTTVRLTDIHEDRVTVVGWGGAVEFVWNGNSIEVGSAFPLIPVPQGGGFIEDGGVLDFAFCSLRAGCQTQSCNPVRICSSDSEWIIGMEGDLMWVVNDSSGYPNSGPLVDSSVLTLQLRKRPALASEAVGPARLFSSAQFNMSPGYGLYNYPMPVPYVLLGDYRSAEVPMPQNGSFYFGYSDRMAAATPHYVLLREDPFTLRFIPR